MRISNIFILFFSLLLVGCNGEAEPTEPQNTPPIAGNYITPHDNQICTGTIVSPTEISVTFEWEEFVDAEDNNLNYTFTVTNLLVNAVAYSQTLTSNQTTVNLERGISYAWLVSATDSSGETVAGPTWQFQTPFEANSNYAPFPATLLTPSNGATFEGQITVNFTWEGNDPDEGETELLTYDIYFGQTNPPLLVFENFSITHLNEVFSQGIYYWKIVSKDPNGNSSESVIRQFIMD